MSELPGLSANRYRDTWCGGVLEDSGDSEVRVAGWVHRRRDHGGVVFVDLRDRTGLVQLVFHPDEAADAFALGHTLRAEDVISVSGPVVRRSPETVNPEMATGEFEVRVRSADQLSDADTPPFEIESFSGEVGEEMRLRHRYLDLRREPLQRAVATRAAVSRAMREFLDGEGFLEIETPVLTRSTPEGARDFLVPARREAGSFYALPQSPQLFKQLLMVGGFERYYQIARCFRDEDQRADRQPDFTQLDIEMSFVEVEDVLAVNERLIAHVLERVGGPKLELPLQRIGYDEAIARFGKRPPGPSLRPRAPRPLGRAGRDGVQGLRGRAWFGRCRQGPQRRQARDPALGARRADRTRAGARRQGPRLGVSRGGRLALADREVPLRSRARRAQPGARGGGGRPPPDRR